MRWKKLTVSQLEKLVEAGKPVYILNTSSLNDGSKGTIVVNFYVGNRRVFFKMPPTFIPMCVTDSVPPNILLESMDFRQTLMKGMLTLVDPDQAEDYLATPEAQDEYEALVLSEHSVRAKGLNVEQEVAKRVKIHSTNDSESAGPVQDVSAVDTVSNKVRGIVESLLSDSLTVEQALTELRRHQSALTPVDISYVLANTTDAKLTAWARKAITEASKEYSQPDLARAVAKTAKKAVPKKKSRDDAAFDFGSSDDDMTPEEIARDAAAKARAMEEQAVSGQSRVDKEIDSLLKG
jgi:hypothetical protein